MPNWSSFFDRTAAKPIRLSTLIVDKSRTMLTSSCAGFLTQTSPHHDKMATGSRINNKCWWTNSHANSNHPSIEFVECVFAMCLHTRISVSFWSSAAPVALACKYSQRSKIPKNLCNFHCHCAASAKEAPLGCSGTPWINFRGHSHGHAAASPFCNNQMRYKGSSLSMQQLVPFKAVQTGCGMTVVAVCRPTSQNSDRLLKIVIVCWFNRSSVWFVVFVISIILYSLIVIAAAFAITCQHAYSSGSPMILRVARFFADQATLIRRFLSWSVTPIPPPVNRLAHCAVLHSIICTCYQLAKCHQQRNSPWWAPPRLQCSFDTQGDFTCTRAATTTSTLTTMLASAPVDCPTNRVTTKVTALPLSE